jgi:hypothetical protein
MTAVVTSQRWSLAGTVARLEARCATGTIDLANPSGGLHALSVDGRPLTDARLLAPQFTLAAADELSVPESYVRGDDLVATYRQTAQRPIRVQIYWRVVDMAARLELRDVVIVELQASINTSLLDVVPTLDVSSHLPQATGVALANGGVLLRPADRAWSYFEIVHPSDRSGDSPGAVGADALLAHRLFGRPLEKGVILRSRIRGAFVPRTGDVAAAEAIAADFATSEPPLTT